MPDEHLRWLTRLTSLPTASGREGAVMAWVQDWVAARPPLCIQSDVCGNLTVALRSVRATARPIYLTAHMDHPAFVVGRVLDAHSVEAEFRGGVEQAYFHQAKIRWQGGDGRRAQVVRGFLEPGQAGEPPSRRFIVKFEHDVPVCVGDVLAWDLPGARIRGDRLHAPACDNLAGVAAALSAMDLLLKDGKRPRDVRLFFTRAEEIGFVGAIGACRAGTLPKGSRLVVLECSRSFDQSPVGGGPIVRVGDRTSIFSPILTQQIGQIAASLEKSQEGFCWQRCLMPGGTCEATAYQAFGHEAACLCLPLGHYHNMTGLPSRWPPSGSGAPSGQAPRPAKIGLEFISVRDYRNLVQLLVRIGKSLDETQAMPLLRRRLEQSFRQGKRVLGPKAVSFLP